MKKFLNSVINYKKDIEPHRFVSIYSGVGSGKNTFIESLIKGEMIDVKPQTVLLITSRRAKVDEVLANEELPVKGKIGKNGNLYEEYYDPDFYFNNELQKYLRIIGEEEGFDISVAQKSTICTGAFVEGYIKYVYRPDDVTTHLWELFDMIVVDEAHALVRDATYQSAPFYVQRLIEEVLERHRQADADPTKKRPLCNHVILMTGSPEPIRSLKWSEEPHVIDALEQCRNVIPKHIWIMSKNDAKIKLKEQMDRREKAIYFSNHIVYPNDFCTDMEIDPKEIAVSFSDVKRRNELNKLDPDAFDMMERTEQSLVQTSRLPMNVQLFLTTSKNEEGINMLNTDIRHMYVEKCTISDMKQKAGRIRSGVENLYFVFDVEEYLIEAEYYFDDFVKEFVVSVDSNGNKQGVLNLHFENKCKKWGMKDFYNNPQTGIPCLEEGDQKRVREYIGQMEKFNPCIKYNSFINRFEYYELREKGMDFKIGWATLVKRYGYDYEMIFQKLFPSSVIHPYVAPEQKAGEYLENCLKNCDEKISEDKLNTIREDLNGIFGAQYTRAEDLLKKCGYTSKRCSKNKDRPAYHQFRVFKVDTKEQVS